MNLWGKVHPSEPAEPWLALGGLEVNCKGPRSGFPLTRVVRFAGSDDSSRETLARRWLLSTLREVQAAERRVALKPHVSLIGGAAGSSGEQQLFVHTFRSISSHNPFLEGVSCVLCLTYERMQFPPPQLVPRSSSNPATAHEQETAKAKRASILSQSEVRLLSSGGPLQAFAAPRTTVELLEFFTRSFGRHEFVGVFRPLWDTMHLTVRTPDPPPHD